jgi:Spy/CpxP family protein refolding chaperone
MNWLLEAIMDKKVLVVLLIISVAINAATLFTFGYFWWARHTDTGQKVFVRRPYMMHDWHHTRMARELGLSEQQIEEMKKANEEMRIAMQPLREELFRKRQELMSLLRDEEINKAQADILIKQIAELQVKHDAQIFDRLLMMKRILTPEQRERLGILMHALLESGRPPGMPEAPMHPHHHFELPRGEGGR